MTNVNCNEIKSSMYAFPQLKFTDKFLEHAKSQNLQADTLYCLMLLKETGICVVPGSGFDQVDGTWHYGTTILPQPDSFFVEHFKKLKAFNNDFMTRY